MSLLRQGKAQALTIYLGESDQWQGKPLYVAIVQLLREHNCAGATVTRAVAGYGAGSRLHEGGGWRWSSDASIVIQVVDQGDRLRRLLPQLQEMLNGGLITIHEVDVLKYTHARRQGLSNKLPVRQVMETIITTVAPTTPVPTVVDLLMSAPFAALPVVDEHHRLLGIISTGDLINADVLPVRRRLLRTALELDDATAQAVEAPLARIEQHPDTARDIMNRQLRTVRPDTSIRDAASIMVESGLRRLPVVAEDGTLLGMLTRSDLLRAVVTSPLMSAQASSGTQPLTHTGALSELPAQQQPIADYVNPDVTTVDEHASLSEVIDALILAPLKRVIVVDEQQRVRGIISDVDMLARIREEARPGILKALTGWARGKPVQTAHLPSGTWTLHAGGHAREAADIMNRDVVTVVQMATVQETVERMIATRRKVLPVLDEQGRLLGAVGRSDLLRVLLEA